MGTRLDALKIGCSCLLSCLLSCIVPLFVALEYWMGDCRIQLDIGQVCVVFVFKGSTKRNQILLY